MNYPGEMVKEMSEEEKKNPLHPETFFLPPLKMLLAFFDKESHPREEEKPEKQEEKVGKNVEKLIEKLSEKEE